MDRHGALETKWCLEWCPCDMARYGNYLLVSHWECPKISMCIALMSYVGLIKCLFAAVAWYLALGR